MLSFYMVNLLIPGDPAKIDITLPSGIWTLEQLPQFAIHKDAISKGQCAETYFLENQVTHCAGSALMDQAFDEITPILLAASYLTGLSVTIRRSTIGSEVAIMQTSEHWPRARAVDRSSPVITSASDFGQLVELFVKAWPQVGQIEKARLLVHHWLDALSCWSMEDLYLSSTTLLQVIVATEAARQGKSELKYYSGVKDAESPRILRRLQPLRKWSHEKVNQIFP